MRRIPMVCANCEVQFMKPWGDARKGLVRGQIEFFCSIGCATKYRKAVDRLISYADKKRGTHDPYRYYYNSLKNRSRKSGIDVTIDPVYIKQLWRHQKGRCRYTGIKLKLQSHANIKVKPHKLASIDRINSSEGYVEGNVQFVSVTCNLAKGSMDEKDFLEFMETLRNARPEFYDPSGDAGGV